MVFYIFYRDDVICFLVKLMERFGKYALSFL